MSAAEPSPAYPGHRARWIGDVSGAFAAAGPPLLFGVRLWLSVCLALYVAFWLELPNAYWAGTSAAIMCQPHLGASLRKGWYRLIGTVIGAIAVVVLTACFPQNRAPFLVGLALWGAGCAFISTLLKNFAAYSAALAGYTVAIIANQELGATGGPNGQAFMLAVYRASEICIGIVCAGIVLAGTDFGQAQRRLGALFTAISSEITGRFAATLAVAGANFDETQKVRRELLRRVSALDPVIDEAFGESSQLRYHSPVLQTAVNGLFAALASWRAVAVHLKSLAPDRARPETNAVLQGVPEELRSIPEQGEPTRWLVDPIGLRQICEGTVRRLIALPASTPSPRLLADQAAEVLAGISHALNGLALLVEDTARPVPWGSKVRLRVPDWLPALINAGRAFVAIGAAELFWIVTEWPNGAQAIEFVAITVILLAPRADQAYAAAMGFTIGTSLTAVFAGIVAFALLPNRETFPAFSLAIGLVLVPAGAGMAQPWQTIMFMDDGKFRADPSAGQPTDLRHPDVLQHRVGDPHWRWRGSVFVSLDSAAVTRISDTPFAGADFARSAPSREGPDLARTGRLAGSYVWPALGIAGRSRPCHRRKYWRPYPLVPRLSSFAALRAPWI